MEKQDILRNLPSIDDLVNEPSLARLSPEYGREEVVKAARVVVGRIREAVLRGEDRSVSVEPVCREIEVFLHERFSPSLRYAVNATGVILHTGLGRAMLAPDAARAVHDAIRGYSTLAVDTETGQRGSRDSHLSGLICELTGAEAATIVNNNAAATMLILNTLAAGREVIVSRGQLVEIGGSFRMPDVMAASGAIMREVGTTNKTHLKDYASAVGENTGAILRVHQSNYRIVGFTEEPGIEELAALAREHGIPLIDDIGSGALFDMSEFGLEYEPMVQRSISAGADVACFSGDKLIGGPQAGIIAGKSSVVERIKKNPLMRALRVGKMTVAAMEATLKLFMNRSRLCELHPTFRMLSLSVEELEQRASAAADALRNSPAEVCTADGGSMVGSGSVPVQTLPTKLLQVKPLNITAETLVRRLRRSSPPVFARVHQDTLHFDFRTIQPEEDEVVVEAVRRGLLGE